MCTQTSPRFSVLAYLLFGVLSVLFVPAVHGDVWALPKVVTVSSPSSNFIAQVTPGSGKKGGYESAITNLEQNAIAVVSVCHEGGITNVVWEGKLINPVAPAEVYVSDGGHLVTIDNWFNRGYGRVVTFYDPKGRLLRHWGLEELLNPEEKPMEWLRLPRSESSIYWLAERCHFGEGTETNTFIVPARGKLFRFALTNGTVLEP